MLGVALLLSQARAFLDITTNNAEHISETPIIAIGSADALAENAHYKHIDTAGGRLRLHGERGEDAYIMFNHENRIDDWSAVITFKKLDLHDTQRASLQLWYTDAPLKEGRFMGVEGEFTGFLAGLELSAGHAEAIFTYNYGFDFTGKDKTVVQRDRLDKHALDGVDEITLKIVHTTNNFLIELYNGARLISDSFRIHQSLLPVKDGMARHFGLTTTYKDCPSEVAFELTDFRVMERVEGEGYDAYDAHTDLNTSRPAKGTREVQHAIANLNHFLAYADIALGGKEGRIVTDVQVKLKETIRKQRARIDSMLVHARLAKRAGDGGSQRDGAAQMAEFTARLAEIHRQLQGHRNTLRRLTEEKPHHMRTTVNMLFVFTIFAALIMLARQVASKYIRSISNEKKK